MLKSLPSIDQIMQYPEVSDLLEAYSRDLVVEWARAAVEELRAELLAGAEFPLGEDGKLDRDLVTGRLVNCAEDTVGPSLRRVVNATGVVIHTNLGRAPLSNYLMDSIKDVLGTYSNLEYDLDEGRRGSRHDHLRRLIKAVTGAEDGFVVNNNAAAVLVTLNTLAQGREVIVSRGELIEIGGSFRIPDIIRSGGAILKEVGTTNKSRLSDYARAIGPDTGMILKVHTSNYKVMGFTEEASVKELAGLANEHGIPMMTDLGSGLLIDLEPHGIVGELPAKDYLEAGSDLVTFSGDKLLGGPQAGFIVGRESMVQAAQKNPMVRALRVGKLTIGALEAMLLAYLSPETVKDRIPRYQAAYPAGGRHRLVGAQARPAHPAALAGGRGQRRARRVIRRRRLAPGRAGADLCGHHRGRGLHRRVAGQCLPRGPRARGRPHQERRFPPRLPHRHAPRFCRHCKGHQIR